MGGIEGCVISDGVSTILVDFPYHSGAFGYMSFASGELESRDNALCLFTHGHDDHFDPNAIASVGCQVAGPPEVLARVEDSVRLGEGPSWRFGEVEIACLDTEHADVDYCSYVIRWKSRSIFFSGDVEELSGLFGLSEPLDIIIVSSWLVPLEPRIRQRFPDAKIVLSHPVAGEARTLSSD